MTRDVASPSPMRARSLHSAMEEAASTSVMKTLSFPSSDDDDDDDNDEGKERGSCCKHSDTIHETSSQKLNRIKSTASRRTFRYHTRRMERIEVYGKQDPPYRQLMLLTPDKIQQQRRSSSEQSTSTPHRRTKLARRCSRSVSPPCASPATLLSHSLKTNLSMKSPVHSRRCPQVEKLVLKTLCVASCPNHFISSFETVQTIRWLGAGISAEVFKVRDPISGALFAVKKSKEALRSDRERDLLTQEIIILDNLTSSRHNFDNIVRYYQAWQENGFFFLQMELCEGGTLQDFITLRNREILPESYLWYILRDIASGLKALSEHGIVHLDIKPDNIFFTGDGRLKVGDFGMAGKVLKSTTKTSKVGFLEGDAKYIAKELLSSADRLPSADIFCLGIMMLEIATGIALPEAGKEWYDLRTGTLPSLLPNYSKDVKLIIQQMMHPDPTKRPSAADILQNSCVQTATEPAILIQEHALKQKLIVPTRVESNTKRSARKGLLTPHKTRRT